MCDSIIEMREPLATTSDKRANMTERQNFEAGLKKILSVSKEELQRRLDAEKNARPSSFRAHADKD